MIGAHLSRWLLPSIYVIVLTMQLVWSGGQSKTSQVPSNHDRKSLIEV